MVSAVVPGVTAPLREGRAVSAELGFGPPPRGRIHGWTNKMTYDPNQPCVAGKLYLSIVEGSGVRAASTGRGF